MIKELLWFVAAEIAWEKRMRKKMKKSLRRQENFKGTELKFIHPTKFSVNFF